MIPKRLATTECRKKGRKRGSEGWMERGRKRGRVRIGRKGRDRRKASEGKEGNEGWREEERKGERALLASAVHVARAPYMNVTQDVAVGLSCILCTTPPDYTEYHARLRSIIQNTMHAFARLYWVPCTPLTDSSISGLRFGPICSIFYENSK